MPFLTGWMIGTKIGDAVASRSLGLTALWLALPGLAMVLGNKNRAPPAGFFAAIITIVAKRAKPRRGQPHDPRRGPQAS